MKLSSKALKRGLLISVLSGAVSVLLVLALTRHELDWEGLKLISPSYFTLAALLVVGAWFARVVRLKILLAALGERVPFKRLVNIFLSSCFISQVTPTTGGGLPLQIYMIYRQGVNFGNTVAASVVDSFLTILFYIIVAPLLLIIWRSRLKIQPLTLGILGFAILAVCTFLLYLILKPEFVGKWLINLGKTRILRFLDRRRRLDRWAKRVTEEVQRYREAMVLLAKKQRSALWWSFFFTFAYWGLYLAIAPVLLVGLNVKFDLVQTMVAQLILNFIQPFFPTPGASGGAELSFAYFFRGVVPGGILGIYVMSWRLITYYLSLISGAISLVYALKNGWLERHKLEGDWDVKGDSGS